MDESTWQLDGDKAQFESQDFSASIDLRRPDVGLQSLSHEGADLQGRILGIAIESGVEGRTADEKQNEAPTEVYVRANELVATYPPTVDRPVGFQVCWEIQERGGEAVVVDVTVSVQTPLLETYPEVLVRSSYDCTGFEFHPSTPIDEKQANLQGKDFLVQQHGFSLAELVTSEGEKHGHYAEMVHPTDFLDCSLSASGDAATESQWRMCDHFMEKGVIRRLRVRAIFSKSALDAHAAYSAAKKELEELATEQPPLTT